MMPVIVVAVCFHRLADKYCGQQGKHESLNQRHKQFERENKKRECKCERRNTQRTAYAFTIFTHDKDEANERQRHKVTRRNVRKKTNGERKRLCKETHKFNHKHQRLQEHRNAREPENVHPEIFG